MFPLEMKFSKSGLGYVDISEGMFPLERKFIVNNSTSLKQDFYILPSTSDYLLKVNQNIQENDNLQYELIHKLFEKQPLFSDVEFPIGMVLNDLNMVGQIIKYYKNSNSLKNICQNEDLESLQKYIYRDDDSLHNFFLVYLEILDILEKLFQNKISYLDVNGGNFVICNNEVKIIDFEEEYMAFNNIRYNEHIIIHNYLATLNRLINFLGISNETIDCPLSEKEFSKIRCKVKNYENKIRRYR